MKKIVLLLSLVSLPLGMTFADGYGMTSDKKAVVTTESTTTMVVPAAVNTSMTQAAGVSFGKAVLGRDCFSWTSCRQLQQKMDRGLTTTTPTVTGQRFSRQTTTKKNPRLRYHLLGR